MSDNENNRFSGNYGSGNRRFGGGGDNATGDRPSYGGGGSYNNNAAGGQGGGGYRGGNGGGGWKGNNNGGGGWKGGNGGGGWKGNGGGGFQKRDQPVDPDPYIAVAMMSNAEPPLLVKEQFKNISEKLKANGYTIRVAGGNSEADDAARDAAGVKMEEYLPWKGFNNRESGFAFSDESSIEQACKFHPAASNMKDAAKKFLSRNYRMVQGKNLKSSVKFIVIWSDDGASKLGEKTFKTGNVGHMLSIAAGTKTPIFNIGKQGTYDALMAFLEPEKEPEFKRDNGNNNGGNFQNRQAPARQEYKETTHEQQSSNQSSDFSDDDYDY